MSYDELVYTIQDMQKELDKRGTTTHCFNVWNNGTEKVIYLEGTSKRGKQND